MVNSHRKGRDFERLIMNTVKESLDGSASIRRTAQSGALEEKPDLVLSHDALSKPVQIECKHGNHVPMWPYKNIANADWLVFRRTGCPVLVTLPLEQLLRLL